MLESEAAQIIYDDEEIRVIWQPGQSDFLLITFGDLITPINDARFFADTPAKKAGMTALGIVAKRGNWYPKAHMLAASESIINAIAGYSTRIAYGGSMGGYAAIKYSKLLRATHVISLCPQWSIDAAESGGFNPGWQDYFADYMSGTGIITADAAGDVFLFVDLFDARDSWHARKIVEAYPDTHIVNVPRVSHHVTTVMAGTDNLLGLIEAVQSHDSSALRLIARRARKGHFLRKRNVIENAIRRSPDFGMRLLVEAMREDRRYITTNKRRFVAVMDYLARAKGVHAAVAAFQDYYDLLDEPLIQLLASALLGHVSGAQVVVRTVHGTSVIYSLGRNVCYHAERPANPLDMNIRIAVLGRYAALSVSIGDTLFHLGLNPDNTLGMPAATYEPANPFLFEILPGPKGRFTIGSAGKFVSAQKNGTVICNRQIVQEWESFRFDIASRSDVHAEPCHSEFAPYQA